MNINRLFSKTGIILLVLVLFSGCFGEKAEVSKRIIIDQDVKYPAYNAKIVSYDFPDVVKSGKSYPLKIVFQNTGKTPWLFLSKFYLGLGQGSLPLGGKARVKLPAYVFLRPGDNYEFIVELTMSKESGEYYEHFRMLTLQDMWFGETLELRVKFE